MEGMSFFSLQATHARGLTENVRWVTILTQRRMSILVELQINKWGGIVIGIRIVIAVVMEEKQRKTEIYSTASLFGHRSASCLGCKKKTESGQKKA